MKNGRQGRDRLESLGNEVEYREKRQCEERIEGWRREGEGIKGKEGNKEFS